MQGNLLSEIGQATRHRVGSLERTGLPGFGTCGNSSIPALSRAILISVGG